MENYDVWGKHDCGGDVSDIPERMVVYYGEEII